jgi:hypothetical protein
MNFSWIVNLAGPVVVFILLVPGEVADAEVVEARFEVAFFVGEVESADVIAGAEATTPAAP